MSAWLAILGSAFEFALTVLLLVTCLVSAILAIMLPASLTPEQRFEKRLEYVVFTLGSAVLLALVLFAPR